MELKYSALGKDGAHKRLALSAAGVVGLDDLGMFLTVACDACSFNINSGKTTCCLPGNERGTDLTVWKPTLTQERSEPPRSGTCRR